MAWGEAGMARPAAQEERLATRGSPRYFNNKKTHVPWTALLLLTDGEQGERLSDPRCRAWLHQTAPHGQPPRAAQNLIIGPLFFFFSGCALVLRSTNPAPAGSLLSRTTGA